MDTLPSSTKMHGLKLIVVDAREGAAITPDLARAIADRHRGVGFDQLIVIETPWIKTRCFLPFLQFRRVEVGRANGTRVRSEPRDGRPLPVAIQTVAGSLEATWKPMAR
jgi:diaminopimelate epimerase